MPLKPDYDINSQINRVSTIAKDITRVPKHTHYFKLSRTNTLQKQKEKKEKLPTLYFISSLQKHGVVLLLQFSDVAKSLVQYHVLTLY